MHFVSVFSVFNVRRDKLGSLQETLPWTSAQLSSVNRTPSQRASIMPVSGSDALYVCSESPTSNALMLHNSSDCRLALSTAIAYVRYPAAMRLMLVQQIPANKIKPAALVSPRRLANYRAVGLGCVDEQHAKRKYKNNP